MGSIDVVVPCYQHGRYLRQCIQSVLAQGISALRVLIIDNASTDDGVSVARALAAEDSRIEVIANPVNRGPHASFNRGIDWASAEYLIILCADDLLAPGALRSAAAYLDMHREVGAAYGVDLQFRDGDALPETDPDADATWSTWDGPSFIADRCRNPTSFLALGSMLVRTAVQKRVGHYRPELPYTDDLEMILRLAAAGTIAQTGRVQGFRRLHGSNLSAQFLTSRLADLEHRRAAFTSFFADQHGTFADAGRLASLAERRFAETAYWWSAREMAGGNLAASAALLRFAVRADAGAVLHLPLTLLAKAATRILHPARRDGKRVAP
jgi:glycosyltransferase involved in cell wall biosynthesis